MATINGTPENDSLLTRSTGDELLGFEGNDILDASVGLGNNTLRGGEGNDELIAGTGDQLFGDNGDDTLEGSAGTGDNTLTGGDGDDELFAGTNDVLFGSAGEDILNALVGDGNNQLDGGPDNDQLVAGDDDTLLGGAGNDLLIASGSNSTLSGNSGADQFIIADGEFPDDVNTITDFRPTAETIFASLPGLTQFSDLALTAESGGTLISFQDRAIALLLGVAPGDLNATNVIVVAEGEDITVDLGASVENAPEFDPDAFAFTIENESPTGTAVGTLTAVDPDADDVLTFALTEGNPDLDGDGTNGFGIDPTTGEITVTDADDLDFAANPNFTLTATVTDLSGLSDTTTVIISPATPPEPVLSITINLLADNDGQPGDLIPDDTVSSNQTFFIEILVEDLREDPTGLVGLGLDIDWDALFLESIDDPFDPTPLDSPLVTAGFPLFRAGELDNAAGTITGLSGGSLPAGGQGEPLGESGPERFSLLRFEAEFPADLEEEFRTTSFTVTFNEDLGGAFADGEELNANLILIEEQDITVLQNEAPELAPPFEFDLLENSAVGTVFGPVNATDPNGDTVTFAIAPGADLDPDGDGVDAFTLDSATGELTVTDRDDLDFETTPSFTFDVTVTDEAGLSDTEAITVNLTDEQVVTTLERLGDFYTFDNDTNLRFTLEGVEAGLVNELGVFLVEDEAGTLSNGLRPGDAGYLEAALEQAQIIFSALDPGLEGPERVEDLLFDRSGDDPFPTPAQRILEFDAGDILSFYLVPNTSTDTAIARFNRGGTPDVFLPTATVNVDDFDHLRDTLSSTQLELFWEDRLGGGDGDFDDLEVLVESITDDQPLGALSPQRGGGGQERELVDLRTDPQGVDLTGQDVAASFVVNREATFDSLGGLYRVDDLNGRIGSLAPGDAGYVEAALAQSVVQFDGSGPSGSVLFEGGFLYAPYLLSNGSTSGFLSPFTATNPNRADNVRLLGDNRFTFEDKLGGGDGDFNDFSFQVDFALA